MYLKSIEIHGFKSFANKIKFEFLDGITGIVGPNGSGKSNVADAVRWVLGEQKVKQLRSSKMEDVIFAGTAARKPQAYAFVAITFDNSDHKLQLDFDEITVSRRVYRSGESEFMINGTVCRMRDVHELFYDTGIGKEGYSIIGQGQIDKILQGRPEDRRELFDEAAGIVKYKKRKTIAFRKLENERQNLIRINDILSELTKQVGPLKRQSEAASKFISYKEELKLYDINLFLIENGDIRLKIRDYEEKEKIASDSLNKAKEEFEKMKEGYEKVSTDILTLDERIEALKNRITQANIVRESMTGQINVLNEQIHSVMEAKGQYKERLEALGASLKRATDEKARLENEKQANQEELTKSVEAAGRLDSEILDLQTRGDELAARSEELKEQLIDLLSVKGEINARIERLAALSEQMNKKREELAESLTRFSANQAEQDEAVDKLGKEYDEAENNVKNLEEDIRRGEENLRKNNAEAASVNKALGQTMEELLKKEARLESVRNITERYEGYGSSIREIMKLKDKDQGIHGVVADIIKTEKKYEVAIETALGGNIQNVVTDTEATAKNAIEYLKSNKLGRATFLPIKSVVARSEFHNEEVFEEKGVLGLASSLVEVSDEYRGVANYLLGRILVVDTIENALSLARRYNYSLIIVTLEGELLSRGGAITGGTYKNKSNLLGRRREIEELEEKIKANKKQQESLQRQSAVREKERLSIEEDLTALRGLVQEKRIYFNTVKINLEQAKARLEEIDSGFKQVSAQNIELQLQEGSMSTQNSELRQALADNADESEGIKEEINSLNLQINELKELEAVKVVEREGLNSQCSLYSGRNGVLADSLSKIANDIIILNGEIEKINNNDLSGNSDVQSRQQRIDEITEAIDRADSEVISFGQELALLEGEKEQCTGSHREYIDKREAFVSEIAELDKEVFRLSQLREKLEERFESKSSYIWEEYELTYNTAIALKNDELTNLREIREKIADLKNSIKSLGTINVAAIEEYKEVRERYEFMTNQRDDLQKAEADLLKIIKDLDREMKKRFRAEFKKIQAEFSKVFAEMFGGGTGTIELEEDVDVLDAGITIIAQPPGKKLQNMMQLSGGEKALTAIAVLFAIQNLKPSPFCILDEIEVALDDSNIGRFADYLQKLANDTQFIIITHRKGTMEAADRLYGITMQEKGVSTLVSVNFEDYDEEEMT
ncbi:MAG: chromosome segregation protein SMC [Lachnospiraceae bacterium]|jgi:chromosome segregation protein